ncbi:hypothetical protein BT63DRAFT_460781 [Microthyrium microscopicum]|uniref:Uncharacterized protein n=1 Tax=Microthyrium microscopicum TaxID=703497 RepID=A0A6A6TUC8_9PEZI|nr:hypothetical protein BT63DRAFT_460781 [Microthyrium microscopicum]
MEAMGNTASLPHKRNEHHSKHGHRKYPTLQYGTHPPLLLSNSGSNISSTPSVYQDSPLSSRRPTAALGSRLYIASFQLSWAMCQIHYSSVLCPEYGCIFFGIPGDGTGRAKACPEVLAKLATWVAHIDPKNVAKGWLGQDPQTFWVKFASEGLEEAGFKGAPSCMLQKEGCKGQHTTIMSPSTEALGLVNRIVYGCLLSMQRAGVFEKVSSEGSVFGVPAANLGGLGDIGSKAIEEVCIEEFAKWAAGNGLQLKTEKTPAKKET